MRLRLLLTLSLLALAGQARAQSADDFFHSGAQAYLSNNVAAAQQKVDDGLKQFPDDVKLKKLDELLKQQQQQQQSQNQQDQQSQQSQSQNDPQKQNSGSKSKPDSSQQPAQNQKPDQQPNQSNDKEPKQQPARSDQEKKGQEQSQSASASPGEMTAQQAQQLLDAQKNGEKVLPFAPEKPMAAPAHLKDW